MYSNLLLLESSKKYFPYNSSLHHVNYETSYRSQQE